MVRRQEDSDSEASEEFTSEQGIQQDEEITKVQRENKARPFVPCGMAFPSTKETRYSCLRDSEYYMSDIFYFLRLTPSNCLRWVASEGKERRRQWAEKITPRPSHGDRSMQNDTETPQESDDNRGMLPDDIVKLLAAQEKKVFLSDSEEEKTKKGHSSRKKKPRNLGLEPVILKEIPPPQCLQNSLEFLKKRKMQVARSSAVLNNSNQALRLISTSGLLSKK